MGLGLMQSTKIAMLAQPRYFRVGSSGFSYSAGGCSTPTMKAKKKDHTTQISEPGVEILPTTKNRYPTETASDAMSTGAIHE